MSENEDVKFYAVALLLVRYDLGRLRVLAVSRKGNPEDFGLPGGKIDPGETPEQAAVRELREETAVIATSIRPIFDDLSRVKNGVSVPCRTFLVEEYTYDEGAATMPIAVESGTVVGWLTPARLSDPSCTFSVYNRALFRSLGIDVSCYRCNSPFHRDCDHRD
jgi:8-oxo-dGTP pyrophosphatase MutT (NUDIX family)